jgi:HPt (histidine-containing phosphotransfer) domain-containing protein
VSDDFDPQLLPPGLLEGYLRSVQQQLNRLSAMADQIAARGGDADVPDAIRREAHKIRGSAGSYGFHEATRVAAGSGGS